MSFSAIDPENATPTSVETELQITRSVNDTSFRDGELAYSRLTKTFFALLTTALVANGTTVLATQSQSATRKWVALNLTPSPIVSGGTIWCPDQWTTPGVALSEVDASTLPLGTQAVLPYKSPWLLAPGTTLNAVTDPDLIPANNAPGKVWIRRKELGAYSYLADGAGATTILVNTVNALVPGDDDNDGLVNPLLTVAEALRRLRMTGDFAAQILVDGAVLAADSAHCNFNWQGYEGPDSDNGFLFVVGTPSVASSSTFTDNPTQTDPTTNTQCIVVDSAVGAWTGGLLLASSAGEGLTTYYSFVGVDVSVATGNPGSARVHDWFTPGSLDSTTPPANGASYSVLDLPVWSASVETKFCPVDVYFEFWDFQIDGENAFIDAGANNTYYTVCRFTSFELASASFFSPFQVVGTNAFGAAAIGCCFTLDVNSFVSMNPYGGTSFYQSTFVTPGYDGETNLSGLLDVFAVPIVFAGCYFQSVTTRATAWTGSCYLALGDGWGRYNGVFDAFSDPENDVLPNGAALAVGDFATMKFNDSVYGDGNPVAVAVLSGGRLSIEYGLVVVAGSPTITGARELLFPDDGFGGVIPSLTPGAVVPNSQPLTNWTQLFAGPFNGNAFDFLNSTGAVICLDRSVFV